VTAIDMAGNTAANLAIKPVLTAGDEPFLRRWALAAITVVLVHAAIVVWLLYVRELNSAGAPPAVVTLELAPLDAAPPAETPPETTPGPPMMQADPEAVEQQQTIKVPELPSLPKPNVVLMTPKPTPKPKKIVKEVPRPVVKRVHEAPAPRTSAPPRAAAAAQAASAHAANPAAAAAWRSAWAAALSWAKHYPEAARARGEQGTVRLALMIGRGGHVMSARLIGSSGSPALDQAALEMARTASGPPLPPEMGASTSVTVPVRYTIR
jgi:protein TonB